MLRHQSNNKKKIQCSVLVVSETKAKHTVSPRIGAVALISFTKVFGRRLFQVRRVFETSASKSIILRQGIKTRTRDATSKNEKHEHSIKIKKYSTTTRESRQHWACVFSHLINDIRVFVSIRSSFPEPIRGRGSLIWCA